MKRQSVLLATMAFVLATAAPAWAGEESSTDTGSAPKTEVPATEVPATEVPKTEVPKTEVPATEVPVTTTTDVPETVTTGVPDTTGTCTVDCIPEDEPFVDECMGADCIPTSAGGIAPGIVGAGGALPFTGIGDVVAPLLLGLVVLIGGVVAWRWANVREAVAAASARRRRTRSWEPPSGYAGATRQLGYEQRAQQLFGHRVA